ncbi:MAG TPA: hypothetical protein VGN73_13700 [Gemmatimonadaceae bacterium]|nr:hypothetical protein [Gemmatimonadaceae bacterium]
MPSSAERDLLANALKSGWADGDGESRQRRAIREICIAAARDPETREQLLITFRRLLVDAADGAQLPHGRKRNVVLGRLAAIFVEEFYSVRLRRDGTSNDHRN